MTFAPASSQIWARAFAKEIFIARKELDACLMISADLISVTMIGAFSGAYISFSIFAARFEETPITILSGAIVSPMADPSRRNSGFDATSKSTFLRLYRLIVSSTFSPVLTGTVLLSTMRR